MNRNFKKGFTLIELVLVVGIVAIISVIAIGKFTDFRKSAARKTNVANIKNIARTINTELAMKDGEKTTGMFAYAESLIGLGRWDDAQQAIFRARSIWLGLASSSVRVMVAAETSKLASPKRMQVALSANFRTALSSSWNWSPSAMTRLSERV